MAPLMQRIRVQLADFVRNHPYGTALGEQLSAAEIGSLIQCSATVTRKTGSMAFIRGEVFTGQEGDKEVVMTFSSVVKRLREQS